MSFTPREAVRKISVVFDIFCLARQITLQRKGPEFNEYENSPKTKDIACICICQFFAFPNIVLRKMNFHEY